MRTVVAGVLARGDRVLVGQRASPAWAAGQWEFPGGKLEPGETAAEALVREWQEELGVSVAAGAEVYRSEIETALGPFVLLALRVELLSGEPQPREHRALAWVRPAELERLALLTSNRPIAAALLQTLGAG